MPSRKFCEPQLNECLSPYHVLLESHSMKPTTLVVHSSSICSDVWSTNDLTIKSKSIIFVIVGPNIDLVRWNAPFWTIVFSITTSLSWVPECALISCAAFTLSSTNFYCEPSKLPLSLSICIKLFFLVSFVCSLINSMRAFFNRNIDVEFFEEIINVDQYFLTLYLQMLKMLSMQLLMKVIDISNMNNICECVAFLIRLISKAFLLRKIRPLNNKESLISAILLYFLRKINDKY